MDAPATRRRFDALVLPHLDAAYNLARWLCGNTGDAEDVVQEAFLRAFRLFGSFRGDQPRPWLLAIVRNTWFTTCEKRRGAAETDYEEGEMDTALPDSSMAPPRTRTWLMREEDVRLVHAALARLPVVFREVIVLRELEEPALPRYRPHRADTGRHGDVPAGAGPRMLAATVTALRGEVPVAAAPAERQDLCGRATRSSPRRYETWIAMTRSCSTAGLRRRGSRRG